MRKLILFFFFLWSFKMNAQITFQKSFAGVDYVGAFTAHQMLDGGYILAGNSSNQGAVFLIKTDSFGDTLWTKTYGSILGKDMQVISGGGFVIAGTTNNNFNGDIRIIKTDINGDTIWTKTYGGVGHDKAQSIKEINNGGYIITGYTESFNGYNFFLMEIGSNGNLIWTKDYSIGFYKIGYSVDITNDGYIIAGEIDIGVGGDGRHAYLVKTDKLGNMKWSKAYDGCCGSRCYSVKNTSDGGFILTGTTYMPIGANSIIDQIYLVKTDSLGSMIWTKKFGALGNDNGKSVIQTADNGYIITGFTSGIVGNGLVTQNLFLIKTNSVGGIRWCKYYGGNVNSQDWGNSVEQTTDGGYIVSGHTSYPSGKAYLLKTDSLGSVNCNGYSYPLHDSVYVSNYKLTQLLFITSQIPSLYNLNTTIGYFNNGVYNPCTDAIPESQKKPMINVLPNPSNGIINISDFEREVSLEIYDISGQVIYQKRIYLGDQTVNLTNKAKGIYFYKILTEGNEIQYGKLILQ